MCVWVYKLRLGPLSSFSTTALFAYFLPSIRYVLFTCVWRHSPQWSMASSITRFLDHTQRRTTVGRTPLDEWSARRRDLYLTSHNTHNRKTSMTPVGFEPTISAGERPQTYALDRAVAGTGIRCVGKEILHDSLFRSPCFSQITCHFFLN
jgi:hypothetical protein